MKISLIRKANEASTFIRGGKPTGLFEVVARIAATL